MADQVLIDIIDVSKQLGVSINTVYSWVNQRKIPFVKLGRLLRFDLNDIEKWVTDRKVEVAKFN